MTLLNSVFQKVITNNCKRDLLTLIIQTLANQPSNRVRMKNNWSKVALI